MTAVRAAGSVADAISAATDALAAAGVDSPRLDAELLLAEATGRDRAAIAAAPEAPVAPDAGRAFGSMVRRRIRREPLAYIVGRKGFRDIEVTVDRRVLVPRPETELLVEVARDLQPATVLDVGTGSGAVALAIASELRAARVTASDVSGEALEVARANAARLGLGERLRFVRGTLPPGERFDLLVANLPYVAEPEWPALAPDIREWEPRDALLAGPDGLGAIRVLLEELRDAASAGAAAAAAIALEVGAGQAEPVAALVRDAGFAEAVTRRDLAGVERVVVGRD